MTDLLYLVHRIPYPPNKGDKLRSYHLLKQLSQRFRVHLGCFIDDPRDLGHVDALTQLCASTCCVRLHPWARRMWSSVALLRDEPMSLPFYRHAAMKSWVARTLAAHSIRHIVTFSSVMAQYVEDVSPATRIADLVDVDSAKWTQYAREASWPLSWLYAREGRTLLAYESRVAASFDATVFVSPAEAELFAALSHRPARRILHARNGVDTEYFDPALRFDSPYPANTRHLVFTGAMDYKPNVDAVNWFARSVLPSLQSRWSDLRLAIVGSNPTPTVQRLGALPGVWVTGTVPDVRPYLQHADAVVAPLLIARGVQNKVLEGMAMGRVVVASSHAAKGVEARKGTEFLVADTTEEYLEAIEVALDPACTIGRMGRQRILDSYSWDANLQPIMRLLSDAKEPGIATRECVVAAA